MTHPWAPQVIESRTYAPAAVLDFMNSLIGTFLGGGLSAGLTHHVMHALGSRMWGFTQEVFATPQPPADPQARAAMFRQAAERFPHIVTLTTVGAHDDTSAVGQGCNDQYEFEFALDILLDGLNDSTRAAGAPPTTGAATTPLGEPRGSKDPPPTSPHSTRAMTSRHLHWR